MMKRPGVEIKKIYVDDVENLGCTNGVHTPYEIILDDGRKVTGETCRCGNGCCGADRLPKVGNLFTNIDALYGYLAS